MAVDLEEVWRIREEDVYPKLFGSMSRGTFTPSPHLFSSQFNVADPDPRWLHYGVLEYAPTPQRASWVYATSGFSNPWLTEPADYDPSGRSGDGVEMVFQATAQGDWAVQVLLRMMVFDLLLAAGRFPGSEPLVVGDRVPLRAPINGDPACLVRNLVVAEPEGLARGFALPSGKVEFLAFTGVTDAEVAFAKSRSSVELVKRLRSGRAHPVTDPRRRSVV